MARLTLEGVQAQSGGITRYTFKGADVNTVAAAVDAYFTQRGYKLEEGTSVQGTYSKGSAAGRAIAGGFVARYKFRFAINPGDGVTTLDFSKGMSGAMGGVLGAARMKKEYETIQVELKAL